MKRLAFLTVLLAVLFAGCSKAPSAFDVSGRLLYNTTVDTPLVGYSVTISTDPYGISPTLYLAITDANGFYQFTGIPEGTYYLYAETHDEWVGVAPNDVTHLQRYIAILSNDLTGNPLRIKSADSNLDGLINQTDAEILKLKIAHLAAPGWALPDWLFENPQITVTGNTYVVLKGMCAGDFNGSYLTQ